MPFSERPAKLFLIAVYTMIDCVVSKNFSWDISRARDRNLVLKKKAKKRLLNESVVAFGFIIESIQSVFVCNQITRLPEQRVDEKQARHRPDKAAKMTRYTYLAIINLPLPKPPA